MKIKKIELTTINKTNDGIIVEIEEYPRSQPVFPADTKAADLPNLLKKWKVNQDAVDAENEARKLVPKPEEKIAPELKALEGAEINE